MNWWSRFFKRASARDHLVVLKEYSSYFNGLSKALQSRFLDRLDDFIRSTKFETEGGKAVKMEMQVIISAAFVQITFGLEEYTLKEYAHIFIAPAYYNYGRGSDLYRGDVNSGTKIVTMAWPAVEEGFLIPDDALNIAIHEFGHCLVLEYFSRPYLGRFFQSEDWQKWAVVAEEKISLIRAGQNKVLRSYGGTNMMELFSVSLENFFERPHYFKQRLPDLFLGMSHLLKQDPTMKIQPIEFVS